MYIILHYFEINSYMAEKHCVQGKLSVSSICSCQEFVPFCTEYSCA